MTKPPTETETGIKIYHCSVCSYEMGEEVIDKLPSSHTHKFGTDWKTNSNSHWHECSCGEKSDLASHTKDSGTVTKKPTETETGIKTYHCSVCGYKMGEKVIDKLSSSHTHKFGTDWKTNSNSHWHECSCGEKSDLASHTKDSGTVTKPSTKTETGIRAYQCTVCGYVWTEKIAKLQQPSRSNKDSNSSDKKSNGGNWQENETTPIKPGTATTKPENRTNQDKTPQSDKEPFIKDADSKIGWDVIRAEEEKTKKGNVINVDMNGSTVVPGDIFERIKGRDITITFDMGNGIIWSVDGKSITTDKVDDINFSVKTVGNAIPIDTVNNVTGEHSHIQLSLTHDGDFGFTAVLSINLGKENVGLTASLYYYNESTGELEFISSGEVAEDGTALLAFTHASDYVIAVGEKESGEDIFSGEVAKTLESENTGDNDKLSQTGQPWKPWWFVVIGTVMVIIGIGLFFVIRRKRGEE